VEIHEAGRTPERKGAAQATPWLGFIG